MIAAIIALACAVLAAGCSIADGALIGSAGGGPPHGEGSTLPHGDTRDWAHRSLAIAKVILALVTGIAAAMALDLRARGGLAAVLLAVAISIAAALLLEAAPRAFGERRAEDGLQRLAPLTRFVELSMSPLTACGRWLDARLLRLWPPAAPRESKGDRGSDGYRAVFQTQSQLPTVQRDILRRWSSLAETEVQEVMVPRVDIVGIENHTPWSEVVDRVRSSQHARLPVYDDTLDTIAGILFAKDILPAVIDGEEPAGGWETKIRPAAFIPEGKSVESQLRDFKSSHNHLAIIVDEYGGTAGLVTIEDILEEIVGDIRDENDDEERPIRSEEDSRFWVSGKVTLDELAEVVGHTFQAEDVTTVGGLVFHQFGRVPKAGESTVIDGFSFTVERVIRRRVDRVFIERPPRSEEEDE